MFQKTNIFEKGNEVFQEGSFLWKFFLELL